MAKPEERKIARKLRKKGKSIKEIAKDLSVSPGSVSVWCRDIELTKDQIAALEKRNKDPHYGRRLEYLNKVKREKDKKIKDLREKGIEEVGDITKRELFIAGISLYWAEGFKKDSQAGFANSDPRMIGLFLSWLYDCCGYMEEDLSLRVTVNVSHKYRIKEIGEYWSEETGINVNQFQKPFFQKVKWKKQYDNPDDYKGILRIRVRKSTDFLRKINGWIEGLSLYASMK